MHQILVEISNFFAAVLSIYSEIPKDLNQQIKTMQAFLRSYDQKQLFLIQNFVKRIEQKAEKTRNQHKRKRCDLKTQPSILDSDNKENVFNMINTYRQEQIQTQSSQNPFNFYLKEKINDVNQKEKQSLVMDIKKYRLLFQNYSSGQRGGQNYLSRPLSVPSNKTPSPIPMISSRETPKINSSPYLEASQHNFEIISKEGSEIVEPNFHTIEIKNISKEQKLPDLEQMRLNIKELNASLDENQDIKILENFLFEMND